MSCSGHSAIGLHDEEDHRRHRLRRSTVRSSLAGIGSANATISVIGRSGDMDPYHYRDELRYAGIVHEDAQNATELGPRICRQRIAGWSSGQLEDSLIDEGNYTTEQAVVIVRGAEFHFCPAYGND
jgi:hypothetical protein